ncbi:MAG TPA: YaiI/YqxD family protein, partial [Stenotrophomonas sp.]
MDSSVSPSCRIWVDADACPAVIRDILFRAAERTGTDTLLVANQWLRSPPSRHIRS